MDSKDRKIYDWCGFKFGKGLNFNTLEPITGWWFDKEYISKVKLPPIDLNFIEKYCLPKLRSKKYIVNISTGILSNHTHVTFYNSPKHIYDKWGDDLTTAFKAALIKLIDGGVDG